MMSSARAGFSIKKYTKKPLDTQWQIEHSAVSLLLFLVTLFILVSLRANVTDTHPLP